ncbi:hypothetical protein CV102_16915 [Natronococcus pandeyae]|uniref:Lipoprotein n=1 Tax=Natronococcus pandeyae TaxID=2055836 RepID=A0A8J8Q2M5_9EURY|nr:hypothetical protein [Natronococcus pandeyae]TYL37308.1 hypothetical protein CV102_16915 [Natronococcus pandeyae]
MRVQRRSVVVAVGGLAALSGCLSTDAITDRVREEATDRAGDELSDRTDVDIEIPDDPPETDDDEWRLYEFTAGEYYEYRIESDEDGDGVFLWTVEDAGDGRLTVETELAFEDGEEFARTVTGTEDEVFSELMATPAAIFIGSGLHSPHVEANEGVYVGYEWRFATEEGSLRYAVEDTASYVGRECYVAVTEIDDTVVHESCLAPELAFPAYVAYYDEETGDVLLEMELVEYRADE